MTRPLHFVDIRDDVADAQCVMIATDFDGTLCPIAETPEQVQLPRRALRALERLVACPKVVLAILSGRALTDIRSRVPLDVIFGGNHGLEISGLSEDFVHPEAERHAAQLRRVCDQVESALEPWPCAWVEDKHLSATVHMRPCPVEEWLAVMDAVRGVVRPVGESFALRSARAALEIYPRIGWDKGSALKYLRRELALEDALTICLGDDATDETMFRSAPSAVTVKVGPDTESDARYSVPDVHAVAELLEHVADTVEGSARRSALCRLPRGGNCRGAKVAHRV